jgi:hypothetical protein
MQTGLAVPPPPETQGGRLRLALEAMDGRISAILDVTIIYSEKVCHSGISCAAALPG